MSWRGHNQRVKWQYNNSISNKTLWCHQVLIKYRPLQVTYLAYWGVSWWWGETKQSRAVAPPWAGEECAEVRWLLISNYKYLHFLPLSLLVCSLLSSKTDLNYSITRAFNKPSGCGGSSWKGLQRSWKYFYCSQVSDRQQRRGGFIWSIVTYLNKIVHDSQVNIFLDFIILYITYKYCKHFISSRPDHHPQAGGNSLFFPGLSIETLMNVYKIAAVIVWKVFSYSN